MNNISMLRKPKMSQEKLAKLVGVSQQAVSNWENGESLPRAEKILIICRVLECTLEELLGNDTKAC